MDYQSPRAKRLAGRSYNVYRTQGARRRWPRVLLWCSIVLALVVLLTAGGSYAWFQYEVAGANGRVDEGVKTALSEKPSGSLASIPDSPSAMNILVMGADKRSTTSETYGRSDTMMVIHVDPDANYMSILSLPRDMWVSIPGYGKDRLNVAYAAGGPKLTIKTIKNLTGININQFVEVDFQAFKDITDALGGIYVDVDRKYYNVTTRKNNYEDIYIEPGYQLLNGTKALQYVRFRHDDAADIGRMNRQQRFLSAAREQAMGWDLPFKLPGIIKGLFNNVNTSLSGNDFLRLAYWGVKLDGNKIRQITVSGESAMVGDKSVLKVSDSSLRSSVENFLTPSASSSSSSTSGSTTSTGVKVQLSGSSIDIIDNTGRSGMLSAAKQWMTALGATVAQSTQSSTTGLKTTKVTYPSGSKALAQVLAGIVGADTVALDNSVDRVTLVVGEDLVLPGKYALPVDVNRIANADMWSSRAKQTDFAVEAPTWIPAGYEYKTSFPGNMRPYNIVVGKGTKPAFKVVYVCKTNVIDQASEYIGIMETTWLDAPAASKGIASAEKNGVTYNIVGTYEKADHVWWKKDGVLYWVSNSLQYRLSANQLLQIAESMVVVPKS